MAFFSTLPRVVTAVSGVEMTKPLEVATLVDQNLQIWCSLRTEKAPFFLFLRVEIAVFSFPNENILIGWDSERPAEVKNDLLWGYSASFSILSAAVISAHVSRVSSVWSLDHPALFILPAWICVLRDKFYKVTTRFICRVSLHATLSITSISTPTRSPSAHPAIWQIAKSLMKRIA